MEMSLPGLDCKMMSESGGAFPKPETAPTGCWTIPASLCSRNLRWEMMLAASDSEIGTHRRSENATCNNKMDVRIKWFFVALACH